MKLCQMRFIWFTKVDESVPRSPSQYNFPTSVLIKGHVTWNSAPFWILKEEPKLYLYWFFLYLLGLMVGHGNLSMNGVWDIPWMGYSPSLCQLKLVLVIWNSTILYSCMQIFMCFVFNVSFCILLCESVGLGSYFHCRWMII